MLKKETRGTAAGREEREKRSLGVKNALRRTERGKTIPGGKEKTPLWKNLGGGGVTPASRKSMISRFEWKGGGTELLSFRPLGGEKRASARHQGAAYFARKGSCQGGSDSKKKKKKGERTLPIRKRVTGCSLLTMKPN